MHNSLQALPYAFGAGSEGAEGGGCPSEPGGGGCLRAFEKKSCTECGADGAEPSCEAGGLILFYTNIIKCSLLFNEHYFISVNL